MDQQTITINNQKIAVEYVPIGSLRLAEYNPRRWDKEVKEQVKESIRRFGMPLPLIVNAAPERKGVIVGGNLRWTIAKELGFTEIAVVFINLPDLDKEKELNVRLNKNQAEFDLNLLANFSEESLSDWGFSSIELDDVFPTPEIPEQFDLAKELRKLQIEQITVQKGDAYEIAECRIMSGDSTIEADMLKLMNGEKADFCLTDPPFLLDYLNGKKKHGKATVGFGLRCDRRYLETDVLPPNFTDLWMDNIAKIQKPDFSIMVYENPKNLRTIWNALEKHWKYRNTVVWHLPNRVQGFAGKYRFFNKYDFAMLGTSGDVRLNDEPESDALLQEEYETALFATSGKPHWESYEKGRQFNPTDFIEFKAADEKSSGQSIIFGTKPVEILIPYIKVLTKRGDLIVEPFGGSGSTAAAAIKMNRRCFLMEKSPVYTQVILHRLEQLTGEKARKV